MVRREEEAEERARSRRNWPVSKAVLGEEPPQRGPDEPTAAWEAVIELSEQAYELAGITPTSLPRSRWPSRLFQPGEPRPDSNGL